MKITKHNKLVRDYIPLMINSENKKAITRTAINNSEKLDYLSYKLTEEVNEYIESKELIELADILEVVYSIIKTRGYDLDYVESLREDKKFRSGGFDNGIILKEVVDYNEE